MKPHRPFELHEYTPSWKEKFLSISDRITPILGDNLIQIEHIGSTSIEGMLAKPQVDMLIIVKDLDVIPPLYEAFKSIGLVPLGREYVGIGDEYVVENAPDGTRLASIHIFPQGDSHIEPLLTFRDYLRTHPDDRDLYAETKRSLYADHHDNYSEYDLGKKNVIAEIKERAEYWKKEQ